MLSTMEYRDWMMVAGAVLLVLRFIGFVFSQKKDADRTRNVRFKCEFDLSAGIDRCASFKIFETDPINVRYGGGADSLRTAHHFPSATSANISCCSSEPSCNPYQSACSTGYDAVSRTFAGCG